LAWRSFRQLLRSPRSPHATSGRAFLRPFCLWTWCDYNAATNRLDVYIPNDAIDSYHMLFLVSADGVPSIAKFVQVT